MRQQVFIHCTCARRLVPGRKIDYQLDDSIKEVVFDKGMCTIVVTNLLTNALKHSPKNTTVTIRTSKNDSYVRVSVLDQGEGMQEEDMEKVFIRFYQDKQEIGGSGVGLSYAKMLEIGRAHV